MSSKYKMDHEKRGIALVINMQTYDAPNPFKLKERVWSVKDVEHLRNILVYLEFEFILCQNYTKSQIEQEIKKQASINHSNSDCFLCVVMSHGNEDKIVTSDNKEISFEELIAPIKSCPTLENKPKLFFFQACRGENEMEISRAKSRPNSGESKSVQQSNTDDHPQNNKTDSHSLKTNKKTRNSAESDLLVYNATLPNHYAYGTKADGTIFIKNVCKVLNEAFKDMPNNIPLSKMILNINKSVRDSGIQLADPINHLMADVYFTPKNLLQAEWMEYLKRENKSKNFEQIKNYYMKRNLKRCIQIDRKILEQKEIATDKENKEEDFTIVHTEEEFNEKCRQNPEKKNIHYLTRIEINKNFLWQKSSGKIWTLKKYLKKNESDEESIDEEEMFQKNNERVLIISAEPGMGKSFILDHFTQNSTAENFFIKIVLNTCKKTLSDKNFKEKLKMSNDLIDFVLKSLLNKTDDQEISLLKNLAKEERLILMFDGLDEINDYKEQIIHLIDELNRSDKIKKILITTRNHLRQELEDHFRTFAFTLNNLNDQDQKQFLYKYWRSSKLKNHERATSAKLKQSAEDLIAKMKSIFSENINQLIGIPLQTKMLADIFVDKDKDMSKLELTNLAELYNAFIETKIRIQSEEKSNVKLEQLSKKLRQLFEIEKNLFYSDHIQLSSKLLFESNNEINLEAFNDEEKIHEILEYGIVVNFTLNRFPTFLHQSFAEFFLAKNSFQKLIQQNKESDKELEEILRDERHFLIRKFLNDFMKKHQQFVRNKNEKNDDYNEEIKNCCRENLLSLLKYFIEQKGATLNSKNKFLIIASQNGLKEIVVYLLENGIDVKQQDEDGSTALFLASGEGHKETVQILLQNKDIDVNQQDVLGQTALTIASYNGNQEIVQMLLKHKDINVNQQSDGDWTALYWASEWGHKEIVQLLLQQDDIEINQQCKEGESALMRASERGHKEIVQLLIGQKDIDVNLQDESGSTALMMASSKGHIEIFQMLEEKMKSKK